ncbi:TrkH family potassium uptake protein (plasmid) [Halobacterium sp. NMX12-1]|uniref:TrkH family potassium uptake protein n=1 Tax=Halobacterium sp. NMX12-1 TaxID=3166650 RepID=A0AAU8C8R9_9EURY
MSIRVNWRVSLNLVGTSLTYLAIPLAFPLLLAVYYGEPVRPFLVPIAITLVLGYGLDSFGTDDQQLHARESFLVASLIWLLIAIIGAIPFLVAGTGVTAHPINALFESMSGITTTGATVMLDFDTHSRSLMMWRQVIQWIGGLGILILATTVLSEVGVGGAQLMESETWTATFQKLTPRLAETARILFGLYTAITVGVIAVLYGLSLAGFAPNMTLYNAVAHAFTSVATAGFSPEPESAGAFTPVVQWVLTASMLVGGTSFILLYQAFTEDLGRLRRNDEFHFYLATVAIASVLIAFALSFDATQQFSFEQRVRHAVFNTVSIITTTGFASVNFDLWSAAAKNVLFACMFLGAMVGSTTCSIKTLRWLVVVKAFRRDLFTAVHDSVVRPVRIRGSAIDEESVRDVYGFVLLSIIFVFALTVFVVVDAARVGLSVSEFEAMSAAASTFLNIGPAFGLAGPYESYHAFPWTTKAAMILLMWVGRVEIIPVMVLFTASFWRS